MYGIIRMRKYGWRQETGMSKQAGGTTTPVWDLLPLSRLNENDAGCPRYSVMNDNEYG